MIQHATSKFLEYTVIKYLEKRNIAIQPKTRKQFRLAYFLIFIVFILYILTSSDINKEISSSLFPRKKNDTPQKKTAESIAPIRDTMLRNHDPNSRDDTEAYKLIEPKKDTAPLIDELQTHQNEIGSVSELPKAESVKIDTFKYSFSVSTWIQTDIPFKKADTLIILAKGTIKEQFLEGILEYGANGLSSVPMAMSRIDRRFPYGSLLAKPTGGKNWNLCGIYFKKIIISDDGYLSFAINDNLKLSDSQGFLVTVWLLRLRDK